MKLYLAGPLFTLAERDFNTQLAIQFRMKGYGVWSPQENESHETGTKAIFDMDVRGVDWADAVVANMDGPDPDSGTAWECGYAYKAGKIVVTYRTDFRAVGETENCAYNIMLWEGSQARIVRPCIRPDNKYIDELVDAIHDALQNTGHPSLAINPDKSAITF